MRSATHGRDILLPNGSKLRATPVFDTYWRFASARQQVFLKRIAGLPPPWSVDPIISAHRFTNVYRAADRVSQYLIREVAYKGEQSEEEIFFRVLLFKIFNKIETWELLVSRFGIPTWRTFKLEAYAREMDAAMARGERLYSAAYIMPSPGFGSPRKHRNHLVLLDHMMKERAPQRVVSARSLEEVFRLLRAFPSMGDFLAFQFAIDLNYSILTNFSEMDFVVAGPGARDGIRKCFSNLNGLTEAQVIRCVAEMAESEFERLSLHFDKLGGVRPLQLIDCQNIFCEVDKYARAAHPEFSGVSGRTRIKQKFVQRSTRLPQFYPPKWGLNLGGDAPRASSFPDVVEPVRQIDLF